VKLRCDLHVNGGFRKLLLMPGPNEPDAHLALKLAACILYWDFEPIVGVSAKHPALLDQEFIPDLLGIDEAGQAKLWVECGPTAMNKLTKVTRRFPWSRIVVMKETEREAERLRQDLRAQVDKQAKIEIVAWPGALFKEWMGSIQEKTEVYGEGGGLTINVVVNERPLVAELKTF
jgi:hypothetical protein